MGDPTSALLPLVDTDLSAGEMGTNINIGVQGPRKGCASQSCNENKCEPHWYGRMNKIVTIVVSQMFHALQRKDMHSTDAAGLNGLTWYIYIRDSF